MVKKKTKEYYMALDYDIIIRKYEEEGEVLFKAFTNELDKKAFYGVGNTSEEAISSFNKIKEEWFEYYLENDLYIPEPENRDEDLPSGKFVVRITPSTHYKLYKMAKRNKQSLNSLVNNIIEQYCTAESLLPMIKGQIKVAIGSILNREVQAYELRNISWIGDEDLRIKSTGRNDYRKTG